MSAAACTHQYSPLGQDTRAHVTEVNHGRVERDLQPRLSASHRCRDGTHLGRNGFALQHRAHGRAAALQHERLAILAWSYRRKLPTAHENKTPPPGHPTMHKT